MAPEGYAACNRISIRTNSRPAQLCEQPHDSGLVCPSEFQRWRWLTQNRRKWLRLKPALTAQRLVSAMRIGVGALASSRSIFDGSGFLPLSRSVHHSSERTYSLGHT